MSSTLPASDAAFLRAFPVRTGFRISRLHQEIKAPLAAGDWRGASAQSGVTTVRWIISSRNNLICRCPQAWALGRRRRCANRSSSKRFSPRCRTRISASSLMRAVTALVSARFARYGAGHGSIRFSIRKAGGSESPWPVAVDGRPARVPFFVVLSRPVGAASRPGRPRLP